MRALVWIVEDTWRDTIAQARRLVPPEAEVTILHVAAADVEEIAEATSRGLLGRRPPPPPPTTLRAISEREAQALLAEAQAELGREAQVSARRGRVEHEVVRAAQDADLLVLARDGDRTRPGPRSIGPQVRFVVDHAPCSALVVWPA